MKNIITTILVTFSICSIAQVGRIPSPTPSGFPNYKIYDSDYFPRYINALNDLVLANNGAYTLNQTLLSTVVAGSWQGGSLAESGFIYGAPASASTILKIDTSNDAITEFGNVGAGSQKWLGSVFCSKNKKIYCAPFNATTILVIDTSNDSFYFFDTSGVQGTNSGNLTGSFKWSGIWVGMDGNLYCMPFDATSVMVITPGATAGTDVISFIDTSGPISGISGNLSGLDTWDAGQAYKEFIYGSPSTAQNCLKINTKLKSCSLIGSLSVGVNKYSICSLGRNSKIYFYGYNNNDILRLDPATDTFSNFGTLNGPGSSLILGQMTLPDGKIYLMGKPTSNSFILDPNIESITSVGVNPLTSQSIGLVQASNGAGYAMPFGNNKVMKVYYTGTFTMDANFLFSYYVGKY